MHSGAYGVLNRFSSPLAIVRALLACHTGGHGACGVENGEESKLFFWGCVVHDLETGLRLCDLAGRSGKRCTGRSMRIAALFLLLPDRVIRSI